MAVCPGRPRPCYWGHSAAERRLSGCTFSANARQKNRVSSSASMRLARASLPKPEPWDCHSQPILTQGTSNFFGSRRRKPCSTKLARSYCRPSVLAARVASFWMALVGHILTALVNELRALQVVSLFTKESDDFLGTLGATPTNGLTSGGVSDIADNILLFQFVKLRSKFYRAISAFKARDSQIDDQARLFQMTGHGIVIDDSPDRAELIFAEATSQPAKLPPSTAAQDRRRQGK